MGSCMATAGHTSRMSRRSFEYDASEGSFTLCEGNTLHDIIKLLQPLDPYATGLASSQIPGEFR